MAGSGRGGDRGRPLRLLHRGAVRRIRHRLDAQPRRLRHRRPDVRPHLLVTASPRPHPDRGCGTRRGVLGAHHGRCRHRPAARLLVAAGRAVAPRPRTPRRSRHPVVGRRPGRRAAATPVPRSPSAGRDHRRARVRHPRRQEAGADRRSRAAHPPPQRFPHPVGPDRFGGGRRGGPGRPADLVAVGGLAAAARGDHVLVGPVQQSDQTTDRQVQRFVLQRSAATLGRGGAAVEHGRRHRRVHGRRRGRRPRRHGRTHG